MSKTLHIIYIPGISDHNISSQRRAIKTWGRFGVEAEICQMIWNDGQPWQAKFDRILKAIDDAVAQGKDVGLVGVSAGATAALNAYAVRKDVIKGVVCIAGKIHRPETVGGLYKAQNPAFITSAYECQKALETLSATDRKRIQTRYGLFDNIVMTRDSQIAGAHNKRLIMILHIPIIATQIYLHVGSIVRFIQRQPH